MPLALFLVSLLRTLVEVALLTLAGQGILALLAGSRRAGNPVYQLFQVVVSPVIRAARWVMPKRILDRHLPVIAFFVLFWLWIFLAYVKRSICEPGRLSCLG
ncbi:MAG: hypothetical protein NTY41_12395 [Proteobacteria bacterium]|nr:hypothetical protein [Pseudomonadota bacterium]